jgi:hypothetical protein
MNPKCLKMIGVLTKLSKTIIMLKNILNLEGAQKLTKNEQKSIKGANAPGGAAWGRCPKGYQQCEAWGACVPVCR